MHVCMEARQFFPLGLQHERTDQRAGPARKIYIMKLWIATTQNMPMLFGSRHAYKNTNNNTIKHNDTHIYTHIS